MNRFEISIIIKNQLAPGWLEAYDPNFLKELIWLNDFVYTHYKDFNKKLIYPHYHQFLMTYKFLPPSKVKVMLIGQSPYSKIRDNDGLAIHSPNMTPELKNIFKCVKFNYPKFDIPKVGHLVGWMLQGVMLLNCALTTGNVLTKENHYDQWEGLVLASIELVLALNPNVVLIGLGSRARSLIEIVEHKQSIYAPHPSPFNVGSSFARQKIFVNANMMLKNSGQEPIDWLKIV